VIDGSDPQALQKLDVIVSCLVPNMRDEVLDAMKQAVSGGVGLLNYGATGCDHPGDSEIVNQINGMTRYGCFWSVEGSECDLAGDHPLMAPFQSLKSHTVHVDGQLTGSLGLVRDGEVLLLAPKAKSHHVITPPPPPGTVFAPLYVSHLGNGRILCFQWSGHQ